MRLNQDNHIPRPVGVAQIPGLLNRDPMVGESAGQFLSSPRKSGKSIFRWVRYPRG